MDLSALHQTCFDALSHDPAKDCNEELLAPALARFAQDAVIRNYVVQAITQEPHVIESFRYNPHQLSFAAYVVQKQQQHHLHDNDWIFRNIAFGTIKFGDHGAYKIEIQRPVNSP